MDHNVQGTSGRKKQQEQQQGATPFGRLGNATSQLLGLSGSDEPASAILLLVKAALGAGVTWVPHLRLGHSHSH